MPIDNRLHFQSFWHVASLSSLQSRRRRKKDPREGKETAYEERAREREGRRVRGRDRPLPPRLLAPPIGATAIAALASALETLAGPGGADGGGGSFFAH